MAEVAYTVDTNSISSSVLVKWSGLAGSDTGQWYSAGNLNDVSSHCFGTFDSATVTIQGSNESETTPTSAVTLHKVDLTSATHSSSASALQVVETMQQYRPSVAGGGGSCSLTVIMKFVSNQRRFRE